MRKGILLIALLASGISMKSAQAIPVPAVDVPSMVRGSDLIVVGRAQGVEIQPGSSEPSESFSISVDRVLKGPAGSSGPVSVQLGQSGQPYRSVANRQYGAFFLHKTDSGTYGAVDPFRPALAASPMRNRATPTSADALARVTQELAEVLNTPGATLTDPSTGVQNLVVGDPAVQAQEVYRDTAAALETIPHQTAAPALYAIATTGRTVARLWAINCLLYMGDSSLLQSVEPILLNPGPDVASTVDVLANSMQGRITSPDAVPTLSALLRSKDVAVRRAAACVLSDIGTKAIIAPLATVALHDQDQQVRYYAVTGLAEATGQGNAPSLALFRENESQYTSVWRSWASSHGE